MKIRATLAILFLSTIAGLIVHLFYKNEVQYWIPTPVPANYVNVSMGSTIASDVYATEDKKFIHFFNPNCPCSKFNLTTYKNLIKKYGDDFKCFAVVQESIKGIKEADVAYLKKLGVTLIADKIKS